MSIPAKKSGIFGETSESEGAPSPAPNRPLSLLWISEELLADTRRVWSKAYGRIIAEEEAVEILTNVKRLAEVLSSIKRWDE